MKYVMKQDWFSFGDDFSIRDQNGEQQFVVDGAAFSFGDKLSFRDSAGRELAYISQQLFSWGPTYEIHRNGQIAAVVKKELFTFFKCRFQVDVPGPNDIEATGDFLHREYVFRRGDRIIGEVSKRWFSWTDTYGIDVAEGGDDVLLLASAVVIDLVCHDNKRGH